MDVDENDDGDCSDTYEYDGHYYYLQDALYNVVALAAVCATR